MNKIFIETVGCPKNQEDSEKMAGLLSAKRHEIVFSPDDADVIIVNTCGFIEDAKRESIETFFDFIPYKEDGKRLIITGCLAQRYPEELAEELPEADAILGVNDYEKLPDIINMINRKDGGVIAGRAKKTRVYANGAPGILAAPRKALAPRHSSYLKIAEGCSNNCAYCSIPDIRGPYRSVPMERLLEEAAALAYEGCKELILIAQDVTWYGKDIYGNYALPGLLSRLCTSARLKDIEWIRLLYCYEERVTEELIEVMANEKKILNYIDIPLQHVNDKLLRNMRRLSDSAGIRKTILNLREAMPDIVIRTTFITGLPGETEQEFEELYDFVKETRFDRLGVFAYSPEEGTDAALMPDQAGKQVSEDRRDSLMQLQRQISLEKNSEFAGSDIDVIVDELEDEGSGNDYVYTGRSRGDAPEIDGSVIFSAKPGAGLNPYDTIGNIVKVRITDAMDYDLVGEMV